MFPPNFSNLSYPKPAQGMKIVLNSAQPAHATGFSNLIRNTCATAKELDLINIRSCLISIVFINKATALHLLQGNLATEGVTLLNNKANSINLSLFLPQQNAPMINRERSNDLTTCSENSMDIANAHKSKTNFAITCIGTMVDMTNFSSLCINSNTIISAILDSTRTQPLYCQILLKFVNPFLPIQHNFFWQKNEKILRALPLSHSKIADIGQTGLFGASCAQAHLLRSICF
jgi:hypothetical protein